jgi:CubicO group peptidase (beta-lactamase class C family)
LALGVVAAILIATASAQEKTKPQERGSADGAGSVTAADRIVQRFMKEKQVPGLVLAVVLNGRLVVEKGYGVRSLTDKRLPDADTLFYIGSLSKAITRFGVELLVEHGKLKLDEPIGQQVRGLPPAWRSIPLKFFLAHQSGIPEPTEKKSTFEEEARTVATHPLESRPGVKQVYVNFNFHVAGQAIESATGQPYLDFMRSEVFEPLGMTRTGSHQTDANSAPGHYLRKAGYEEVMEVSPKSGEHAILSGFLQSTLRDLLRFYRGMQSHRLLSPARTREMFSPVTPGKTGTPGWFARPVNGGRLVFKDGAVSGYSSQFQFVPARGHAVIFIMNLQGQALGTASLAHDLLREVCGVSPIERRGAR